MLAACFAGWNYLSLLVAWLTSFGICFVAAIVKYDSVLLWCIPQCLCDTHNYYVVAMKWPESFTFDFLCKIWSAAQSSWPVEKCVTGWNYLPLLVAWPTSVGIWFVAASTGTIYRHTVCVPWLTSLLCHCSCILTQHRSVRFQAMQHFLINHGAIQDYFIVSSEKLKCGCHITVHSNTYFIF